MDLDGKPITFSDTERALLQSRVDGWVAHLADGPELEATLRRFVQSQLERLASEDRPLPARRSRRGADNA